MRRTKAEAERTRADLLDAAEALFWRRGVARTSLDDIAKAAGTTRGAIYHHFKNKLALLQAMLERRNLGGHEELEAVAADSRNDPLEALRAFWIQVFERLAADAAMRRVLGILMLRCEPIDGMEDFLEFHRAKVLRSHETMTRVFERARRRGRLVKTWTPHAATIAMHALVIGLLYQWLRDPRSFDIRREGIVCIERFLATVGVASARSPAKP